MVGVWVGASMTATDASLDYLNIFFTSIATFLVCAAGNIGNDLADIEIDRINRPERILVRGLLSTAFSKRLLAVLNLLAVAISLTVNFTVSLVCLSAIGLLYLYNHRLKRILLLGNLTVAALAAMTLLAGGYAVNVNAALLIPGPLIGVIYAFILHFIRELVKDAQDIEGDSRAGVITFPSVAGIASTLRVVLVCLALLFVFTVLLVKSEAYGSVFAILVIGCVNVPLLGFFIYALNRPTQKIIGVGSFLLKIGMAVGLFALVIG